MSQEYDIEFRSYDGVRLGGTATVPTRVDRAALLVHGIDSYRDEFGFYSGMAAYLASHGIATFRFDYRCHGVDSKRPLTDLTLAGIANDITKAYQAFMRRLGPQSSISVIAASFGGGVAATWCRWNSANVSRLVLLAPVLDYANDYLAMERLGSVEGVSEDAAMELDNTGTLLTSRRRFSRALISEFPYFSARPTPKIPILVIHGDADNSVPFRLSQEFADGAANCKLIRFAAADHGFAEPGDNDLDWPETKANHQLVYEQIRRFHFDLECESLLQRTSKLG